MSTPIDQRTGHPWPSSGEWDHWLAAHDPHPVTQDETDLFLTLTGLQDGERVADFGCGTGAWTRALAGAGAWIHGFDFSRHAVRRARLDGQADHYTHWDIDRDERVPPLLRDRVDVLTFRDSLQWLRPDTVARAFQQWLRPSGRIHIRDNTPPGVTCWPTVDTPEGVRWPHPPGDPRFQRGLTVPEFSDVRWGPWTAHAESTDTATTLLVRRRDSRWN
ncbi:methyltransferase domain-containing protein [Streptomyces sp. SID4919]|uniref:class I SAM-dependent methyltransferase n=1 Tax=unclassified Streptomyces TaxID=2593676 RepID=UPI000823AE34|nr:MULTISPECIES: class I SAM-dependent methyltransferase [unclassified Streptomyces]MYY11083.1 methyltransferase domain-containing protein [Streptomyces sp. SID4919]SCK15193.1 Methylase involved in ubiquinone/menaquinone biosynthesis [Streptomyces sp. AmelKG-E11A]